MTEARAPNQFLSDWRVRIAPGFLRVTGLVPLADFLAVATEALTPLWCETEGSDLVRPLRASVGLLNELHTRHGYPRLARRRLSLLPIDSDGLPLSARSLELVRTL